MSVLAKLGPGLLQLWRAPKRKWLTLAALVAAGFAISHAVEQADWLTRLRYAVYNRQMQMRWSGSQHPLRTAIVLLDDNDYWGPQFESRTPLKRDALAAMLDRVNALGVSTVALDVDLRSPQPSQPGMEFDAYKAEDEKLYAAVERMCAAGRSVVLAASIRWTDDGYALAPSVYDAKMSDPKWACVKRGYIQLPYDMRRLPGRLDLADDSKLDSMSLAAVGIADRAAHDAAAGNAEEGFRFSQYLSEKDFEGDAKSVNKYVFTAKDLMEGSDAELKAQLANRIVFVGAHWHTTTAGVGPLADQHDSPGGIEPGVMLHANYVEAMLDRTGTFAPMADWTAEALELSLSLALIFVGEMSFHAAWKWTAIAATMLAGAFVSYFLMQSLGLFLDFLVPVLMVPIHTVMEKVVEHWHHHQELAHELHELRAADVEEAE